MFMSNLSLRNLVIGETYTQLVHTGQPTLSSGLSGGMYTCDNTPMAYTFNNDSLLFNNYIALSSTGIGLTITSLISSAVNSINNTSNSPYVCFVSSQNNTITSPTSSRGIYIGSHNNTGYFCAGYVNNINVHSHALRTCVGLETVNINVSSGDVYTSSGEWLMLNTLNPLITSVSTGAANSCYSLALNAETPLLTSCNVRNIISGSRNMITGQGSIFNGQYNTIRSTGGDGVCILGGQYNSFCGVGDSTIVSGLSNTVRTSGSVIHTGTGNSLTYVTAARCVGSNLMYTGCSNSLVDVICSVVFTGKSITHSRVNHTTVYTGNNNQLNSVCLDKSYMGIYNGQNNTLCNARAFAGAETIPSVVITGLSNSLSSDASNTLMWTGSGNRVCNHGIVFTGSNHCINGVTLMGRIESGTCNTDVCSQHTNAIIFSGINNTLSGAASNAWMFSGENNCISTNLAHIYSGKSNRITGASLAYISKIYGGECNSMKTTSVGTGSFDIIGGYNNTVCGGSPVYTYIIGGRNNITTFDRSYVVGSDVTTCCSSQTHTNNLIITNIPLSLADAGQYELYVEAPDDRVKYKI